MENKKLITEIRRNYKDNLPSAKKIIKYQENLYNMVYRDGKWIRRYNARRKENKEIKKKDDISRPIVRTKNSWQSKTKGKTKRILSRQESKNHKKSG